MRRIETIGCLRLAVDLAGDGGYHHLQMNNIKQ